jgi:hypothetical protein
MLKQQLKLGLIVNKANMNEKLTWKILLGNTWILVDTMNRIQAQVMRPGVHSRDWIAMAEGRSLGRFLNPDEGKLLVEQTLGIRT